MSRIPPLTLLDTFTLNISDLIIGIMTEHVNINYNDPCYVSLSFLLFLSVN